MVSPERLVATDPLLALARQALQIHTAGGDARGQLAGESGNPARGCFVSLKKQERLRGCMGTIVPTQPSLEAEVVANSLAAALRDPRFKPLRPEELDAIRISIDLLSPLEAVASAAALDPSVYGVLVRAGNRSGVLLPDLPGVYTAERQIEICREKAGIEPHAEVSLQRFTVERIAE